MISNREVAIELSEQGHEGHEFDDLHLKNEYYERFAKAIWNTKNEPIDKKGLNKPALQKWIHNTG